MSRNDLIIAVIMSALALAGCESHNQKHHREHDDDATEMTIHMDHVPANVRQAFEREFPGAKVNEIEKETYRNGTVHYAFEFTDKQGRQQEVEFSADGDRLPDH